MGKRGELRRQQKEAEKQKKTYTMTALELSNMMNKVRQEEHQKAKAAAMSKVDETTKEILTMMLVIPVNVLISDYWQKSAKKRIPKFVDDCLSLYESFMAGSVDMADMEGLTEKYAGIRFIKEGSSCEKTMYKGGNKQ